MQSTANRKAMTIHRSERICIDISDSVVSVIKLDPKGVMMKAGSAKAPTLQGMPDDAYVTDLSAAIKKAAWAAKVSMGFGASCVVGVSMPDITIQRFRWPEMPTDALLSVAATEIVPYLPGSKSVYHVGCEVLGQVGGELEVLVAAMPEEHAIAVDTACRWANFKPKRLDIRENARSRLVQHWCAPIEGVVPTTFAILDVGPGAANIAFYHNGLFHSNRYFAPEFVKLDEVEDFETLMSVKAGGLGSDESAIRYDTAKLTGEITSAIDHFYRLIGGDRISCVLLMDDENIPGIEESLRTGVGVPVLGPSQWVLPGIKLPSLRRLNQDAFLDAFAVGMPSLADHDCRMDLCLPNQATGSGEPHVSAMPSAGAVTLPEGDMPSIGTTAFTDAIDAIPPQIHTAGQGNMCEIYPEHPVSPAPIYEAVPQQEAAPIYDTAVAESRDHYSEGPEIPIPAGYVELPELPPELAGLELEREAAYHDEAIAEDKFHESPFDIISAKTSEQSGFPYAIPEDPRPDPSSKIPLIAAVILVAVIFAVAVFVPQRSTRGLRSELLYLRENIAGFACNDELYTMGQELTNTTRLIESIQLDIGTINERMGEVRDFYLRLPALVMLPAILSDSGLQVDSVFATESLFSHQITVTGRTNDVLAIPVGLDFLRSHFEHHQLLTISFSPDDIDAEGFLPYTITITVNSGWVPFWLNSHVVRSWP